MKYVTYVTLIVLLTIGVSGCMFKKASNDTEVIKREVITYMEDKYNEEFIFSSGYDNFDAINYMQLFVRPARFPDNSVRVSRNVKTGAMLDGYMELYMREGVEEVVNQWVPSVYPDSITFFYVGTGTSRIPSPDMTVEEFMDYESRDAYLSLDIYVEDPDYMTNRDKDIEALRLLFKEKKLAAEFTIHYIKEGELKLLDFENRTEKLEGRLERDWYLCRGDFSMDSDYSYSYTEWREIK